MNDGPNKATNIHIVGTILDKAYRDGNPFNELRGMQSVYLGPASRAVLECVRPEKGRYPFLDHSFSDDELGAKRSSAIRIMAIAKNLFDNWN